MMIVKDDLPLQLLSYHSAMTKEIVIYYIELENTFNVFPSSIHRTTPDADSILSLGERKFGDGQNSTMFSFLKM